MMWSLLLSSSAIISSPLSTKSISEFVINDSNCENEGIFTKFYEKLASEIALLQMRRILDF